MCPFQFEELRCFRDRTINNYIRLRIQIFRKDIGKELGEVWSDLRRLEYARISRCDCGNNGHKADRKWEVPGCDDQNGALRCLVKRWIERLIIIRHIFNRLGLRPFFEFLGGGLCLSNDTGDFESDGLKARLPDIFEESIGDRVDVFLA